MSFIYYRQRSCSEQAKHGARRKRATAPCFSLLVIGTSHEVRLNEAMSDMKTDFMIGYILINGIACNIAFYPVKDTQFISQEFFICLQAIFPIHAHERACIGTGYRIFLQLNLQAIVFFSLLPYTEIRNSCKTLVDMG